jgi:serine/threonine protein kinase
MKIKSIRQIGKSNVNSPSINTSYVLSNCQSKLNSSIENTNRHWIQLKKVFQNLDGKHIATILGVLEENSEVVVKIQPIYLARNEFMFEQKLRSFRGFIEFGCMVTCGSSIDRIDKIKDVKKEKLCDRKGDNIGIIVMPYYKNGSFKDFLESYKGTNKHKHTIHLAVLAVLAYYAAYKKLGFVHGDFYSKNVIVDENYRPLIIDFEQSSFNSPRKLSLFWRDIENFLNCIYPYVDKTLDTIIRTHVVMNNAYSIEPNDTIIKGLTDAILLL